MQLHCGYFQIRYAITLWVFPNVKGFCNSMKVPYSLELTPPSIISPSLLFANAPINGMPHLAYLGQMLEKEGEFGIGIFPEGLVHSRDCQNESRTAGA